MKKVAIYVEGKTEMFFVYHLLLNIYSSRRSQMAIDCFEVLKDGDFGSMGCRICNENAKFYFEIINVGGDKKLLSTIINRGAYNEKKGFQKIIGIRDMYSLEYKHKSKIIDQDVSQRFIEQARKEINDRYCNPKKIVFIFSIMEIEAWLLAFYKVFERQDKNLSKKEISNILGFDIETENPENKLFHPKKNIEDIYEHSSKLIKYKEGESVSKFMSKLKESDITEAKANGKISHFFIFLEELDRVFK